MYFLWKENKSLNSTAYDNALRPTIEAISVVMKNNRQKVAGS